MAVPSAKQLGTLKLVVERPGMSMREIAGALGVWVVTVRDSLRVLARKGLVVYPQSPNKGAKRRCIVATAEGRAWVLGATGWCQEPVMGQDGVSRFESSL